VHRKKPFETDKTHPFFKKMEKEHGAWEPNKFKYPDGSIAAPGANRQNGGAGTGNAGNTPPASPKVGPADSA